MASALIRIASPGVVLLAYVWTVAGGLPVTEGAPDSGPGGLSLAESRRLAAEADALIEEDRGGEAVDKLTALLEVYPNNHIYMWSLAEAHLANGNHAGRCLDDGALHGSGTGWVGSLSDDRRHLRRCGGAKEGAGTAIVAVWRSSPRTPTTC